MLLFHLIFGQHSFQFWIHNEEENEDRNLCRKIHFRVLKKYICLVMVTTAVLCSPQAKIYCWQNYKANRQTRLLPRRQGSAENEFLTLPNELACTSPQVQTGAFKYLSSQGCVSLLERAVVCTLSVSFSEAIRNPQTKTDLKSQEVNQNILERLSKTLGKSFYSILIQFLAFEGCYGFDDQCMNNAIGLCAS